MRLQLSLPVDNYFFQTLNYIYILYIISSFGERIQELKYANERSNKSTYRMDKGKNGGKKLVIEVGGKC